MFKVYFKENIKKCDHMDGMAILLQFGILASVLIFVFFVGLASGLADMPKKWLLGIDMGYFVGIMAITYICQPFASQITSFIYSFNTWFYILMACIMITAGVMTIREYKAHGKNTSRPAAIAIIAPCPCCFGAIISSILIVTPMVGMKMIDLSWIVAVSLVIIITLTYFGAELIVKLTRTPYPILLGNFMFFIGLYFLLSPIVIPNITAAMSKQLAGIEVSSLNTLIMVLAGVVVLILFGAVLTRKNSDF